MDWDDDECYDYDPWSDPWDDPWDEDERYIRMWDDDRLSYMDFDDSEIDAEFQYNRILTQMRQKQLDGFVGGMDGLRKEQVMTDITLLCGGKKFEAHKLVLIANSPYFRAMFTGGMKEQNEKELDMKDVNPEAMETLLEFMYTAKTSNIKKDLEFVQNLVIAADYLQLDTVKSHCWKILKLDEFRTLNNFVSLLNLSSLYMESDVVTDLYNTFGNRYMNAEGYGAVATLPLSLITSLVVHLAKKQLSFEVLQLIIVWVSYHKVERVKNMGELLKLVDLNKIPKLALNLLASNEPLVAESSEFEEILRNVLGKRYTFEVSKDQGDDLQEKVVIIEKNMEPGERNVNLYITSVDGYWHEEEKLKIPTKLPNEPSCLRYDKDIYCVGEEPNKLAIYRVQTKTWEETPKMNVAAKIDDYAILDGFIYAANGKRSPEKPTIFEFEKYDPSTKSWQAVPSFTAYRGSFIQVAGLAGKLYALTWNWDTRQKLWSRLKSFDPNSSLWMDFDISEVRYKNHITMHICNDVLYLIDKQSYKYWKYSPFTEEWSWKLLNSKKEKPNIQDVVFRNGPKGAEQAWVLDSNGGVFVYDTFTQEWVKFKTGFCDDYDGTIRLAVVRFH